jgi:hypothetical protein
MSLTPTQLAGMTTNERLFASGKLDDFDRAVAGRDIQSIRAILKSVNVDNRSIAAIISQMCPPM